MSIAAREPPAGLGDVEAFLQDALQRLTPDPTEGARPGRGRPRVLPALCLWAGLLVCVLRGFSSQLALWRLLSQTGLWQYPRFPVSDQAIYHRLARAGPTPLEALFAQVTALLATRLAPYAATDLAQFATEVVALDETTLDPVARTLPTLRPLPRGAPALLPGKLSGVFDLRQQQWRTVQYQGNPQQNEKVAARGLVATLPAGSLVLADLGYFGFAWFDHLTDQGLWWVSRLRATTSYTVQHAFYRDEQGTFDGLLWLGAHRADRTAHLVRLVQFRRGAATYQYLTNVLDPHRLPLADVARLYARRWDIELAFKLAKRELGLHLLWSAKPALVLQQVWAVLLLAQILQALRLEIAGRAGVDPFDVSLPLLVQYLPQFAAQGVDPMQAFVDHGRAAGFIRPSRRTVIHAPHIPPEALHPPPPNLPRSRPPRYARRRC
jgi:hypothetical protein